MVSTVISAKRYSSIKVHVSLPSEILLMLEELDDSPPGFVPDRSRTIARCVAEAWGRRAVIAADEPASPQT